MSNGSSSFHGIMIIVHIIEPHPNRPSGREHTINNGINTEIDLYLYRKPRMRPLPYLAGGACGVGRLRLGRPTGACLTIIHSYTDDSRHPVGRPGFKLRLM